MKKIALIVLMVIMADLVYGQEVVQYPYHCYLEWPMAQPMDSMYNYERNCMTDQWVACGVMRYKQNTTMAREFVVDTPTTIYGIALTLWGQDTARRDVAATLMNRDKLNVTRLKEVRWFDSMPFRYVVFESRDCWGHDSTHYIDTVKAYEFYFDAPVVVTDTFLVGFHTFGVDGLQHEHQDYNIDSTGYVYLATKYSTCNNEYSHPKWRFIVGNQADEYVHEAYWAGVLPIIVEPPCNPDTLTCAMVTDMAAMPLDSLRVKFFWSAQPAQQDFQISVGLQGTPPGSGRLLSVSSSSLIVTDNWDTTATYEAYIRARCEKYCDSNNVEVWSDWAGPVSFFGYQPQDPIGIATPDDPTGLFALMPNPAKDRVRLLSYCGLKSVTVYDAQGRMVLSQTAEGNETELDISQWAEGSYVVVAHTERGTAAKWLVVGE